MDFGSILTTIADKGWRIALPIALAGGATLLAHRLGWPEADVFQPWLGAASVAVFFGSAVAAVALVSSIVSGVAGSVRNARYEARQHDRRAQEIAALEKEMFARLKILPPFQKERLREMLEAETNDLFMVRSGDGPSQSLVETGLVLQHDFTLEGSICRFNPLLKFHRQRVLELLRQ